jgi:hypothetical protein
MNAKNAKKCKKAKVARGVNISISWEERKERRRGIWFRADIQTHAICRSSRQDCLYLVETPHRGCTVDAVPYRSNMPSSNITKETESRLNISLTPPRF